MPARLHNYGLADFAGRVRLSRRFGYPGRIDAYEHVWLTFAEIAGRAEVTLNGQRLGTGLSGACEFEATWVLGPRNWIEVLLDADRSDAGLPGEVALEIRRDAFLRSVSARPAPGGAIALAGLVVGTSVRPLELYVLGDGRNMAYALVEASAEGQPFNVSIMPESTPQQIRLELVCGAEQWYAVELPLNL
jgi:hypothetical protein